MKPGRALLASLVMITPVGVVGGDEGDCDDVGEGVAVGEGKGPMEPSDDVPSEPQAASNRVATTVNRRVWY